MSDDTAAKEEHKVQRRDIELVYTCGSGELCTNPEEPGKHRGDFSTEHVRECIANAKRIKRLKSA